MDQGKTTVRYARAFFELAREKGRLGPLKDDIAAIGALHGESQEFRHLLESPVISLSKKISLLESALQGKVQPETLDFIRLITRNRREANLPGICRNFIAMYRKGKGIRTAVFTSAVTLGKAVTDQIRSYLETEMQSPVELSLKVDPTLIGGFILRIDDRQVDVSVAHQLKKIKRLLLEAET